MLSEETADEFNKLYNERAVNLEELLFKVWLVLKNASLPTEAQVLQKIIEDHTAQNIPKRQTNRKGLLGMIHPVVSGKTLEQASKKQKLAKAKPKDPKKANKKNPSGGRTKKNLLCPKTLLEVGMNSYLVPG